MDRRDETPRPALSPDDVRALLANPDAAARAAIAERVGRSFTAEAFSDSEARIALDILRMMAADAEAKVRRALAEHVRFASHLPHDIALRLGRDAADVAVPFLQATAVLSDADLVEILRAGEPQKQVAIARRPVLSERLCEAVIETASVDAVAALAGNTGARLSEAQMGRMLDAFGALEAVNAPLVQRAVLPVTIAERLVALVSDRLQQHILTHHAVSPDVAADLFTAARERATLRLGAEEGSDIAGLVTQLYLNGRLTPSLVLRAACQGDLRFLEEAFARLAKVPDERAFVLIHDQGPLGLKAIYERTGLPLPLYAVFRAAVDISRETKLDGRPHDTERFARTVVERVLTRTGTAGEADTEFLLQQLERLAAATAGERLGRLAG